MIHLTGPDRVQSRCWVMNWIQTQLYAQRKGSFSPASGFALLVASTSDEVTLELKSCISLCFPCQSRIPTLQKHKIPLPLATEIPASHPFFQLKSRISLQKKAKSRVPPNLLGTLIVGQLYLTLMFYNQNDYMISVICSFGLSLLKQFCFLLLVPQPSQPFRQTWRNPLGFHCLFSVLILA